MIWFSKQFIDVTIRTGTDQDVINMVALLISLVVTAILLRQLYYYLTTKANTHQSNTIRLRVFSSLFRRQMYEDQLHSGDVTSRLSKDIDTVHRYGCTANGRVPIYVLHGCSTGAGTAARYTVRGSFRQTLCPSPAQHDARHPPTGEHHPDAGAGEHGT